MYTYIILNVTSCVVVGRDEATRHPLTGRDVGNGGTGGRTLLLAPQIFGPHVTTRPLRFSDLLTSLTGNAMES